MSPADPKPQPCRWEDLRAAAFLALPSPEYFAMLRQRTMKNLNGPENPATMSWLERLGVRFDLSPAVVGALGLSMVALLISAMAVALHEGPLYRPDRPLAPLELGPLASSLVGWPTGWPAPQPQPAPRPEAVPPSTEPVTMLEVGRVPEPLPAIQPASYSPGAKPN